MASSQIQKKLALPRRPKPRPKPCPKPQPKLRSKTAEKQKPAQKANQKAKKPLKTPPGKGLPALPRIAPGARALPSKKGRPIKSLSAPIEIMPAKISQPSAPAPAKAASAQPEEAQTALQSYLSQLSRIPLLSRGEEFRLASHYYKTGDPEAARALIEANLRFVIKVAAEYSRFRAKIMDLIQEGNVGLVRAVHEFNPYKGARLITYAVWWIRGYIQEYLLRRHSIVRIGTSKKQQRLFYLLQREKQKLEEMSAAKLLPNLAKESRASEKEAERMSRMVLQRDLSLDQPLQKGGGKTFLDLQADDSMPVDEALGLKGQEALLRRELNKLAPALSEKERAIIETRWLKTPPATLRELAGRFQVSREAIRQNEERLLKKLREKLAPVLRPF